MLKPGMRRGFAPIWFGYPFADLSYWVALVFTLGCVAWVVNGHAALHSHYAVLAGNKSKAEFLASVAAVIGGTLFEVGSWLLYWEALNQYPDIATGKQLVQLDDSADASLKPQPGTVREVQGSNAGLRRPAGSQNLQYVLCPVANECPKLLQEQLQSQANSLQGSQERPVHEVPLAAGAKSRHCRSQLADVCLPVVATGAGVDAIAACTDTAAANDSCIAYAALSSSAAAPATGGAAGANTAKQQAAPVCVPQQHRRWQWIGLRYRDLGFAASLLQLIGATIFWVPCIFGAPRVFRPESIHNYKVWDSVYWLMQVLGAVFFISSSWLFMLEVQPAWYYPKPQRIGWHVGFWNLIGSVGFLLSGCFGFLALPQDLYQLRGTVFSTLWGSWAFFLGSYLQLVESVNKHPESLSLRRRKQSGVAS